VLERFIRRWVCCVTLLLVGVPQGFSDEPETIRTTFNILLLRGSRFATVFKAAKSQRDCNEKKCSLNFVEKLAQSREV
jgi:hypothetical protein